MALKQDWLYSIIALLFIKTQTRTHAHTHAHKSILSKIIFFKCLFEQDFRWFIANRKGKSYSNKRHQQELLNEKLNYLKKDAKKATNNTQLASFKRRGHHHRWPLTRWIEFAPFNTRISQFLNPRHCFEVRHLYLPGAEHP